MAKTKTQKVQSDFLIPYCLLESFSNSLGCKLWKEIHFCHQAFGNFHSHKGGFLGDPVVKNPPANANHFFASDRHPRNSVFSETEANHSHCCFIKLLGRRGQEKPGGQGSNPDTLADT